MNLILLTYLEHAIWGNTFKLFIILVNSNNKTVQKCNLYPRTKVGLFVFFSIQKWMKIFERHGSNHVLPTLHFLPQHSPGQVSVLQISVTRSVMRGSLQPCGQQSTRLFCPWDSPDKNTGVGCHFLLQEIFQTEGANPSLLHWQVGSLLTELPGKPGQVGNAIILMIKMSLFSKTLQWIGNRGGL